MPISRKQPNPFGDKAHGEAAHFRKRISRHLPGLFPSPPEHGEPVGFPAAVLPELAKYVETLIPAAQEKLEARSGNADASLDFDKAITARIQKNSNIVIRFKTKKDAAPISIGNPEAAKPILEKCITSHDYETATARTERFIFKFFPTLGNSIYIHIFSINDLKEYSTPRTDEQPKEPFRLTGGKDEFIQVLDQLNAVMGDDASLRAVFDSHAINQGRVQQDPIAAEIAATVTERWDDRKDKHPGEPWIKNPSKFVSHVYKTWLDQGTLKLKHLQHDPELYASYSRHISEKPKDDLGLETGPQGRKSKKQEHPPKP